MPFVASFKNRLAMDLFRYLFVLSLTCLAPGVEGWHVQIRCCHRSARIGRLRLREGSGARRRTSLPAAPSTDDDTKIERVEEYRNAVTQVLSNLMQKEKMGEVGNNDNPISKIDFQAPKIAPSTSLETLAAALDFELSDKEWFVTGNVNPAYFSEDFKFQDPDVKVDGIREYAKGVYKLFDQSTSRAEIISTVVNEDASTPDRPVITCTWRLSGGVNIGFGLTIKPYIVFTDFVVDPKTSLIVFQEDRFDIPSWDILLSALFPFLIGRMTSPPTPPVPKRDLIMPKIQLQGQSLSPNVDLGSMLKSIFPGR